MLQAEKRRIASAAAQQIVMPAALEGLRVVDLTENLAGPFCTMILADMGAEVIKVERPGGGDESRRFPPFVQGEGAGFLTLHRGKKSVILDLKDGRGREAFRRLVARADVLVEAFRPGTLDRLGLGPGALRGAHRRLIVCSLSGFGQTGPYRDRGGYDLIAQAMSGLMSVTGEPGRPPEEHLGARALRHDDDVGGEQAQPFQLVVEPHVAVPHGET